MNSEKKQILKSLISNLKSYFKVLDIVIFLFLAVLSVFLFVNNIILSSSGTRVYIYSPHEIREYDLSNNRIINLDGLIGESIISIDNGEAAFLDSPCVNKYCIQMSPVAKNGQTAACLPNGIYMTIKSDETDNINNVDVMAH